MKEALFILAVIAILAIWTAVRYRRQINGMIGFAKVLKQASSRTSIKSDPSEREVKSVPLVNCSACGIWVPQTRAVRVRESYYCSDKCLGA
jgi:hypothetical protein